jgi:hypothetical protein
MIIGKREGGEEELGVADLPPKSDLLETALSDTSTGIALSLSP